MTNEEKVQEHLQTITENIDYILDFIGVGETGKTNDMFEEFFSQYHKKTGLPRTDKEAAKKKWKQLKLSEKKKAMEKIAPYYNSVADKTYVKKARTYLKDKNFNDEFTVNGAYSGSF